MNEKEKGKRLIKIRRTAMRQPQVSYTSVFVFFIFHLFLTRSELEGIKSAGSNFCCNFLCNIFGWNFLVGQNPMDANNWRPTIPGGEPVIDMGYWRIQLQPDSRKRIIDKIMETLKRHLLFSGQEGLQELKKFSIRFEEKIYITATNQMLSMEIRSQNAMPTAPMDPAASLDYTAQTGHAKGADWQEEIYEKIKVIKETYFPEINEMHQRIAARLQQLDSLPHQPNSEQLEKLEIFKTMLERLITFLQVSKNNITPSFKEKLGPMRSRL
ncbi:PREDICTED: mediator of RNA polymerase II transcription subunit 15a-like isoform X2 [Populus euphratica]|uniref:Mediator of RNA polymerase II transcription subunit 15a-like isoform X2 n=1 Tax=Populus euphratica TaxID=75702 RepID=A0AAJ6TR67_POPEU|nr:PREDICTED: mediator of RNA polymerase II transcription subunit 15a-like isoform X2 [Populus euphratica]